MSDYSNQVLRRCRAENERKALAHADYLRRIQLEPDSELSRFCEDLRQRLPEWHFTRYGCSNDLLCAFPPHGMFVSLQAWLQIKPHAMITGVHGPYYLIRKH